MNIEVLYKLYTKYNLVDIDTRSIRQNTIFFALKGETFNGNKFALRALQKGANYAVVDEEKYTANDRIILVENVLETLQKLATYHRNQLTIPVIALAGSNGKTTTKELINAILLKKHKTIATKGNLNNHIGVPLTLLSIRRNTEVAIVEMGANHLKEIEFLSSITQPDYGYITNFGKAHLEGFGSIEGVVKGKSELYDYLINSNKTAIVNSLDHIQLKKTENIKRILFDTTIQFLDVNPFVKLRYKNQEIQSNLIGKYNFNNIAAAITIGNEFGVSTNLIKEAIEDYIPTDNRSQIINKDSNKIILDAYNANPSSMKVAIENFNLLNSTKKIVILGDMFELGKGSAIEHQVIADLVDNMNFITSILVGNIFTKVDSKSLKFSNYEELKEFLLKNRFKNSTILIKASRGMALERILELII